MVNNQEGENMSITEGIQKGLQQEYVVVQKEFKHKVTGEVKTQINILEMGEYEEVQQTAKKERIRTTAALCANAIKKELKQKFPLIKFKVRSDNYSMGDSVDISYVDAVPTEQVEALTDKYQAGSFDGMTDMYTYYERNEDLPRSKYVMVQRTMSEETKALIKKTLTKYYEIDEETWNNETEFYSRFGCWTDQLIYRTFMKNAY